MRAVGKMVVVIGRMVNSAGTGRAVPQWIRRGRASVGRRTVATNGFGGLPKNITPEQAKQLQSAMGKMMKDPKIMEAMKSQMQAMAALEKDPEFAPMFDDIRKNGLAAFARYQQDPVFMAKIAEKMPKMDKDVEAKMADIAAPGVGRATSPIDVTNDARLMDSGDEDEYDDADDEEEYEVENLFDAARYGNLEICNEMLSTTPGDLNAQDDVGRTPLHFAIAFGHEKVARRLMKEGADLAIVDEKGNTPLHYAAGYGYEAIVEALIARGADKKAVNSDGRTAADVAKLNSLDDIAELLS